MELVGIGSVFLRHSKGESVAQTTGGRILLNAGEKRKRPVSRKPIGRLNGARRELLTAGGEHLEVVDLQFGSIGSRCRRRLSRAFRLLDGSGNLDSVPHMRRRLRIVSMKTRLAGNCRGRWGRRARCASRTACADLSLAEDEFRCVR